MIKKIINFFKKSTKKSSISKLQNKNQKINFKRQIIFDDLALKVLNKKQQSLKILLEDFSTTHFLGGGTAIALQLGHRESIDFDFFSNSSQGTFADFVNRIKKLGFEVSKEDKKNFSGIEFENQDEIHITINGVKISLINYYRTLYNNQKILISGNSYILGGLRVASLEELAVMKVFAMISRQKWKDAVDLFFLMKKLNLSLEKVLNLASGKYFINIFNKEAVLEQIISKFWDKTEAVKYLISNPPKDEEIENFLKKEALKILGKISKN